MSSTRTVNVWPTELTTTRVLPQAELLEGNSPRGVATREVCSGTWAGHAPTEVSCAQATREQRLCLVLEGAGSSCGEGFEEARTASLETQHQPELAALPRPGRASGDSMPPGKRQGTLNGLNSSSHQQWHRGPK